MGYDRKIGVGKSKNKQEGERRCKERKDGMVEKRRGWE